jgi:hypothetical protein
VRRVDDRLATSADIGTETTIDVRGEIVTSRGGASSAAHMERTPEDASIIEGVNNQLAGAVTMAE